MPSAAGVASPKGMPNQVHKGFPVKASSSPQETAVPAVGAEGAPVGPTTAADAEGDTPCRLQQTTSAASISSSSRHVHAPAVSPGHPASPPDFMASFPSVERKDPPSCAIDNPVVSLSELFSSPETVSPQELSAEVASVTKATTPLSAPDIDVGWTSEKADTRSLLSSDSVQQSAHEECASPSPLSSDGNVEHTITQVFTPQASAEVTTPPRDVVDKIEWHLSEGGLSSAGSSAGGSAVRTGRSKRTPISSDVSHLVRKYSREAVISALLEDESSQQLRASRQESASLQDELTRLRSENSSLKDKLNTNAVALSPSSVTLHTPIAAEVVPTKLDFGEDLCSAEVHTPEQLTPEVQERPVERLVPTRTEPFQRYGVYQAYLNNKAFNAESASHEAFYRYDREENADSSFVRDVGGGLVGGGRRKVTDPFPGVSDPAEKLRRALVPRTPEAVTHRVVDSMMAELKARVPSLPIAKISDSVYTIDTPSKKYKVAVHSSALVVRVGCGYESILTFLEKRAKVMNQRILKRVMYLN